MAQVQKDGSLVVSHIFLFHPTAAHLVPKKRVRESFLINYWPKSAKRGYRVSKFDSLDLRHAEPAEPQILGLVRVQLNPAILQLWCRDRFAVRKTVDFTRKKKVIGYWNL